jgi:hypothetical protein
LDGQNYFSCSWQILPEKKVTHIVFNPALTGIEEEVQWGTWVKTEGCINAPPASSVIFSLGEKHQVLTSAEGQTWGSSDSAQYGQVMPSQVCSRDKSPLKVSVCLPVCLPLSLLHTYTSNISNL